MPLHERLVFLLFFKFRSSLFSPTYSSAMPKRRRRSHNSKSNKAPSPPRPEKRQKCSTQRAPLQPIAQNEASCDNVQGLIDTARQSADDAFDEKFDERLARAIDICDKLSLLRFRGALADTDIADQSEELLHVEAISKLDNVTLCMSAFDTLVTNNNLQCLSIQFNLETEAVTFRNPSAN